MKRRELEENKELLHDILAIAERKAELLSTHLLERVSVIRVISPETEQLFRARVRRGVMRTVARALLVI